MIDSSKNKKEPSIDELLDDLQQRIDRLKVLYEQYFLGLQKLEPLVARREIQRVMLDIAQKNIRNTGIRFRFNTLNQKWNVYTTYWNRTCSQIANGTYIRDIARAQRNMARRGLELPDEMKRNAAAARIAEKEKARVEEQMSAAFDPTDGEPFGSELSAGFDDIDSLFDSIADTRAPRTVASPSPFDTGSGEFAAAPPTQQVSMSGMFGAASSDATQRELPRAGRPDETQRDLPAAGRSPEDTLPGGPWPDQTVRDLPAARRGVMPEGFVPPSRAGAGAGGLAPAPPRPAPLPPMPGMPPAPAQPAGAGAGPLPGAPLHRPPGMPAAVRVPGVPTPIADMLPPPVAPSSRAPGQPHRTPRHITRPRMQAAKRAESSPGMPMAPRAPAPAPTGSPAPSEAQMRDLYQKYVSAKKQVGEPVDKVSFEALAKTVERTASAVSQQHNARAVDFSVAIKDNKVILKATPKK
ncbi:MAG: hypothetical protein IT370_17800 [Deltaproteobacteria bacterium]|nr:hypothetical protein [Deltaproteobacteria bacterium]